ncbi:MAG: cAMP-activated global transcriptional regulator CRP [Halopseudomonas yangmingensis]
MLSPHLPRNLHNLDAFLRHCEVRKIPARTPIIHAGDQSDSLYYIIKGSVTIHLSEEQGREVIIAYLSRGDFFGEMGLFEQGRNQPERSAGVRSKTACEIAEISYTRFRELTQRDPELIYALCRQMTERLRNTTRKVSDLAFLDVTGRVARALLELSRQPDAMTHPDGMVVKITRQEIARMVGCSREMVGRVLRTLEEQDLIEVHGQQMLVFGTR